jgi:hypothetical protein
MRLSVDAMALPYLLVLFCVCNHAVSARVMSNTTATKLDALNVTCIDENGLELNYPELASIVRFTLTLRNCTLTSMSFPKLTHINLLNLAAEDDSQLSVNFPALASANEVNGNLEDTSTISSFHVGRTIG